jgi:hypothetical protein
VRPDRQPAHRFIEATMRAAQVVGWTLLATLGLQTQARAEDAFVPWAPATAGLPSSATISVQKVYVHGIKPSVGMDESMGAPLSAAILSTVRGHAWSKGRTVVSGDEVRLGSPNIATFIDACVSGPCVVEIARSVGCGVALSATISKVGSTFLVDALAVDSRNSQVVARVTDRVKGKDASSLLDRQGLPRVFSKRLSTIIGLKTDEEFAAAAAAAAAAPAVATTAVPPAAVTPTAAATTTTPAAATTAATATTAAGTETAATTGAAGTAPATATDGSAATTTVETTDTGTGTAATETSTVEATQVDSGGETPDGAAATETATATTETGGAAVVPTDEEGGLSAGVFIGAGVAVVGVLLAAGGGLAMLNAVFADQELEKQRHAENQVRAIIEQGQIAQTLGYVLLGGGAVALAVGAGVAGGSL